MMERTLILAKPDALVRPTKEQLGKHYADDPEWKESVGKKRVKNFLRKAWK